MTEGDVEAQRGEVTWPQHAGGPGPCSRGLPLFRRPSQCLDEALVSSLPLPSGGEALPLGNIAWRGRDLERRLLWLRPSLPSIILLTANASQIGFSAFHNFC